jgi:Amt family ammonium transporter
MQAGFTLCGNWIFKIKKRWEYNNENLMDFAIGTVGFWAIGYTIMYGDSIDLYRKSKLVFFDIADMHSLFFQTVFAATAKQLYQGQSKKNKNSTIPYLFFNDDRFIYPISGHWVWQGEGWLTNLGFIDFAGSTVVHSVGWAALVAAMVGPRLGNILMESQMLFLATT